MLSQEEADQRLMAAQKNKSLDVNCVGFVLFMLGVLKKETLVVPTAHRIKRYLEKVTSLSEASVFGIWSLESKYYHHFAFIHRTPSDIMVYERGKTKAPVQPTTIDDIIREYKYLYSADLIESHYLRLRS